MKKLFALISLLAVVGLNAQVITSVNLGALTNNVFTNSALVTELSVASTDTNTLTVKFYDYPYSSNTFAFAAYTNVTSAYGYSTNIFTNDTGIIISNKFYGLKYTTNSVAANTNELPVLAVLIAQPSTVVTRSVNIPVSRGLTYSCDNTNGTLTVTYRRFQ